jgi:hypothetical protein
VDVLSSVVAIADLADAERDAGIELFSTSVSGDTRG